jgi:hypothetical protein
MHLVEEHADYDDDHDDDDESVRYETRRPDRPGLPKDI